MALVRRQQGRPAPTRGWNLAEGPGVGSLIGDIEGLFDQLASPLYSGSQWAHGYPVDLYETAEDFVVEMAVPGIEVDDLDISIEARQLTIRGTLPEASEDGRRYWLQTIPHGEFTRTINLPSTVTADDVEARVHNGLLTLRVPKAAEARARKIQIRND